MMKCDPKRRKRIITEEEARERATSQCVRAETCEYELRNKFDRWGIGRAAADRIIAFLYDNQFLDESRFARAFANDKVRFSGWGKFKIRMELKLRRIGSEAIQYALEGLNREEYNAALERVGRAKCSGLDLEEYNDRAKLYRRIVSRGFESAEASRMVAILRKKLNETR